MLLFIGHNPDEEVMSWSETKKLTWKDFKAEPKISQEVTCEV